MFSRIFADNRNKDSVASQLRQKRFKLLVDMVNEFPATVNILDVGGTQDYWMMMANGSPLLDKIKVTLLNLYHQETTRENFSSVVGDATLCVYNE